MKIYYIKFDVEINDNRFPDLKNTQAFCWVSETTPEAAIVKSEYSIKKDNIKINRIIQYPYEVNHNDFEDRDIGTENYLKCKKEGLSILYLGVTTTVKSPTKFSVENKYQTQNTQEFLKKWKKLKQKGKCLHYSATNNCDHTIKSHSIQKRRMLSAISHNGHVYAISTDLSDIKKNAGAPIYKLKGIDQVSTFQGFCQKHDNELFTPIDDYPLQATNEQVFLYSYRSVCREINMKTNSYELYLESINKEENPAIIEFLKATIEGTEKGLNDLKKHKMNFDKSLKKKDFLDIEYVVFCSEFKPNLAFSGLCYPYYDFQGNHIQTPFDKNKRLQLLSFCSAPLESGWGYIISWHKSSSEIGHHYVNSLATATHLKKNIEDYLFRQTLQFENLAFSPIWWEALEQERKDQIINYVYNNLSSFSDISPDHLSNGLDGICKWKFGYVKSNY